MMDRTYSGQIPHAPHPNSIAAANRIAPKAPHKRQLVFDYLMQVRKATDQQMCAALAMGNKTQNPRRRELEQMGLVVDSGERVRPAKGLPRIVWTVTDKAVPGMSVRSAVKAWKELTLDEALTYLERWMGARQKKTMDPEAIKVVLEFVKATRRRRT